MTGGDFANVSARARAPANDEADLRAALTAGGAPARRDAALALVDHAAEGALDDRTATALADRATADDDPDVRQFAVEALGVAGRGADALVAALDDPSEWVRAEAVVAISRLLAAEDGNGDERADGDGESPADARERVRRAATDDGSGLVRRNAVIALAKSGDPPAALLVDRVKHDTHPAVREYAAEFLPEADVGTARGVRLLAALLARDPNAFVRAKAARGLGRYGTERAVEALESHGLDDRSEDVTRAAEHALADARGEETTDDHGGAPGGGPGSRRERARREDGPGGGRPAGGGRDGGGQPDGPRPPGSNPAGRRPDGRGPTDGDSR